MGRTYIARTLELKKKISEVEHIKKSIQKFLKELKRKYHKEKKLHIAKRILKELKKKIQDAENTKKQLKRYLKELKKEKKPHRIKKQKREIAGKKIIIFFLILIFSLLILNFYNQSQFKFTGSVIQESGMFMTQLTNQIVLNQPVKWKKEIVPDEIGGIIINLPENAEAINVKKIKNLYSENGEVPQINKSPSQEELLQSETEKQSSPITGAVISNPGFFKNIFRSLTGRVISESIREKQINFQANEITKYEIEYETPAPYAIEKEFKNKKEIKIIGPDNVHYRNVLAFTELSEEVSKEKIRLERTTGGIKERVPIINYIDENNNGLIDKIEWIVPQLSEQTYEIIIITKAEHLDSNREFISDIYDEVKEIDKIWSETINSNEYVRVTFAQKLDSSRDITLYPKVVSGTPKIEIYEVDGIELIAEFTSLNSNEYNKVFLTNLEGSQDVFDLRVLDGSIEIDYIVDPLAEIIKVGTDTYSSSAASPLEFSHTLVEGDNRIVVVYFGAENNGENDVTSVTYGGQSMTQAVEDGGTGTGYQNRAEIWYILENDLPSDGSNTISATISSASTLDFKAYAAEYTGVNQGVPEATDGTYQTSGATISNTISPSAGAWVFSAMDEGNTGSWEHGQGQEELWDFEDASSQFAVAELRGASGETSLDSTFTGTANRLARVAASFTPAVLNSAPSTPTEIECNTGGGWSSNCNISVDDSVDLNASGSTDDDSDVITYFIEASLEDIVTSGNSTDVSLTATGGAGGGFLFYDGFNEGPAEGQVSTSNWTDGGGDYHWLYGDGNTPSGSTGDNVNVEGDYFIYIESSSHTNENNYLVSSEFELASSDTLVLDFLYYMYGAHIQTLKIEIDYGGGWDELWSAGPGQIQTGFGQAWSHGLAYASDGANAPYTGTHQIRINGLSGTSYYGDICVDVVYLNVTGSSGTSNETNTTAIEYTDVGVDGVGITNVTIQVDVTSYDPRASVDQSTNDPDLWLEMWNSTDWINIGAFDLPSTYTGTGLQTNNENFSLSTTDSEILTAWASSVNQDLRIKGVYMDHNETLPDQINYTNIWISINGKLWVELGNHTESSTLTWDTSGLAEQTGIDLRARAIDIDGTNTYSNYFTKNSYLNISHGEAPENTAPQITFVSPISNTNPTEDSTKSITFYATMYDADGVADLNDASVNASFSKAGETTRYNSSCVWIEDLDANSANYSCTINMWYFDGNGEWNIIVYGKDDEPTSATNDTTTFTYNLLTSMVMSPNAINWAEINLPDTDIGATNDPITINNTGNDNALTIDVTAYDLQGETTATEYIYAHNFTIGISSEGCSGTAMANASAETVGSAVLNKGNHSVNDGSTGQEQLYFCLKGLPQDISAQSYSSEGVGVWEIRILLVALIPRKKKRKSKKKQKRKHIIKDDKLLEAFNLIADELKTEYSLNKKEILQIIIEKLKTKYNISRKEILNTTSAGEEIKIPVTIFSREIGALESLTKYMKENLNMSYHEIAQELNRNERTIWTSYKKAKEKQKEILKIKQTNIFIPLLTFKNKKLTILESVILYLKEKGMKYSEIANLIDRDQRNIWTIHSRAVKKSKR